MIRKNLCADFNDIATDGTLPLTCAGSVTSIARLEEELEDGEEVWLTDEGGLRVRGRVFRQDGSWEVCSDWDQTTRSRTQGALGDRPIS